jgi:cell division protein FtsW (lipid II flippase)
VSLLLQFATAAPADAISLTQRLLSDAGWLGAGAGTFPALLPIYQDLGSSVTNAPSTASVFVIELGWPMFLFVIAIAAWLIVMLYRGALARGRDSFYPAAAAACAVTILGEAFCDTSLLHSCVAVVGSAVVGLGLAQSFSVRSGG